MPVGTSELGHTYFKVVRPHTLPAEQVVSERYNTRLRAKNINEKEMTAICTPYGGGSLVQRSSSSLLRQLCCNVRGQKGLHSGRGHASPPEYRHDGGKCDIEIEPHWLSTKEIS